MHARGHLSADGEPDDPVIQSAAGRPDRSTALQLQGHVGPKRVIASCKRPALHRTAQNWRMRVCEASRGLCLSFVGTSHD